MKFVTVVGARPQFIKLFPVNKAINEFNTNAKKNINNIIIHTGQHSDPNMSNVFFEELALPQADYNLNISGGSHGVMTAKMLEAIEEKLKIISPDLVIVYGDTNSTLAGALAAIKLCIPIAHVESGLRSYNMKMPEEVNRILVDRISEILFCPSIQACRNLEAEGIRDKVFVVGDVMYDAVLCYKDIAKKIKEKLALNKIFKKDKYVLCTVHRQENTDDPNKLKGILQALNEISITYDVIFPLHPRTKKIIDNEKMENLLVNLGAVNPLSYLQMLSLEMDAACILTDSGGVQKEAFFNKVPCITLRDDTEWVETVGIGVNIVAGHRKENILAAFSTINEMKFDQEYYPFGKGDSAKKIIETLAGIYG